MIAAVVALPLVCCCLMSDSTAQASVIKEEIPAHCHSAETPSQTPQKHSCDCPHSFLSAVVPADSFSAISVGGNVLVSLPDILTVSGVFTPDATPRWINNSPPLHLASLPLYIQYSNLRI